MEGIDTVPLECPNCGEAVEVLVDCSVEYQEYTEDCAVCCRPMVLCVTIGDNGLATVQARREDQ